MPSSVQSAGSPGSRAEGAFQSTLWSQVRAARERHTLYGQHALEELCRAYWQPIYVYLRRCGHERHNAKDLTQGFFVYLLEHELLQKADPNRGRFRSFLLGSLKFFISNEQAKERALKRGGATQRVPILIDEEEGHTACEPATHLTPDRYFERKWALAVVGQAMDRLEAEYVRAGMAEDFRLIQPYIAGDPDGDLSELAARLGKNPGTVRVLMFRVRNRFRRLVRAVIADTVSEVDEIEKELRYLEAALRGD